MAAELEYTADGKANMFYKGQLPWHREGFVLDEADQYDFDKVMDKHFNIPYIKLPFFMPEDGASIDKMIPNYDQCYIWRSDIKKNLGSVGGQYEIVDNKSAFEVLKPLLDKQVCTLETGGVLRDGADTWLMVKWDFNKFGPVVQEVFANQLLPYATVMANHNGRRGLMLGCTTIRIVCANTLGAAETEAKDYEGSRWETVKHKGGAKEKLDEAARKLFHGIVEKFERIARQYKLLMATELTDAQFKQMVIDELADDPLKNPKFNPDGKLAKVVLERYEIKQKELFRLWQHGKGHTGEKNAWFALNAAIEAVDHNKQLWPNRSGTWRSGNLLVGELGKMKGEVTDNLVKYALSC